MRGIMKNGAPPTCRGCSAVRSRRRLLLLPLLPGPTTDQLRHGVRRGLVPEGCEGEVLEGKRDEHVRRWQAIINDGGHPMQKRRIASNFLMKINLLHIKLLDRV